MKTWNRRFYEDFDVSSTFYKFTRSTMHKEYNSLWATEELDFSESAGDKPYLLFYVLSRFSNFQSSMTQKEFSSGWVTRQLYFSIVAM